jgi:Fe2+ or Zn2+ uptake regulation protein
MLEGAKLYCTGARLAVLEALSESSHPLSQDEIAAQLQEEHHDKATIYRALEAFLKAGLVHRAFVHQRKWHFELAANCTEHQCHPHFTCTSCGRTSCLLGMSVPLVNKVRQGYIVHRQQTRFEGLCPDCA